MQWCNVRYCTCTYLHPLAVAAAAFRIVFSQRWQTLLPRDRTFEPAFRGFRGQRCSTPLSLARLQFFFINLLTKVPSLYTIRRSRQSMLAPDCLENSPFQRNPTVMAISQRLAISETQIFDRFSLLATHALRLLPVFAVYQLDYISLC